MKGERRHASAEQTRRWNEELKGLLLAHVENIARIAEAGRIAVLVLHPVSDDEARRTGFEKGMQDFARWLGWDGKTDPAVFEMPNNVRRRFADRADAVTAAWLRRKTTEPQIFVVAEMGTLLVGAVGGSTTSPGRSTRTACKEEEPWLLE